MLIKVNRISAWVLLVLMAIYIITGYAWSDRIIMSLREAVLIHTHLDLLLIPVFLVHAAIGTRLMLKRYRVGHQRLVDAALLSIALTSYALVLMVDLR
ncbi:MAG: hypothetical protein JW986_07720 [Methanotrichaceae archaeon]|nr:hypothetical protein [Methanotrichaceae archaeon]